MPLAHQAKLATENNFKHRMAKVNAQLRQAAKDFGGPVSPGMRTTMLQAAWDDWRVGRPTVGAATGARQFIDSFLAGKFSASDGSLNSYAFMRTPAGIEAVNEQLRVVGLPEDFIFDVKAGVDAAKASGRNPLVEVMEQVKGWEVTDPIDTLSKLYGAAERVALDAATMQNFTKWMLDRKLAFDPQFGGVAPAGYVKLTFSGDNRYGKMLDPDMLWDPAVAREIGVLDAVSRESRVPNGPLGKFVKDIYDPVQGAWKYAITQLRPGHHPRNMIGDASLTFVAEGTKYARKSYEDAWKVLHEINTYDDISVAKALEYFGKSELPKGGDVLFKGKNGYDDLTVNQAAIAMESHGLVNSYAVLEDIVEVGRDTKLKRALDAATLRGTGVERGIASFSEGYQHYFRIQHFLQYVYKGINSGRFKGDYDQLFRSAATQVRRHHPDASMLANTEAKVLRRIIPFYTWIRFALPAIVEGALVHPGRTIVFPKGSYNLAVAMGLNPDTLADPFPDDQLFPSFLTEQTFGPQFEIGGNYVGVNPGFAATDVSNMLLADPIRGVAGSVSPILRIIPELVTGGSMATGSQIKDTSDYLDASIPGLNYLSNVTGTSATGSAVSLLTTGKLDPQAQVAAGNKGGFDQGLSALNWLSGLNIQNMSRPNYINYAEIEKRNREGGPSANF